MPTTPMFLSSVSLAHRIYLDKIDTGVKHLPAVTRELLRTSLDKSADGSWPVWSMSKTPPKPECTCWGTVEAISSCVG